MPFALLLRLLARIALLGAAGALGRRGVPPAWRTPGQQVPGGAPRPGAPARDASALSRALARRFGTAVDVARIAGHLVAILVFLAATITAATAGTTLATLGPRWVGIVLLVLAAFAGLVTVGEVRTTIRLRDDWRRRRRADRLRAAAANLPPAPNGR